MQVVHFLIIKQKKAKIKCYIVNEGNEDKKRLCIAKKNYGYQYNMKKILKIVRLLVPLN